MKGIRNLFRLKKENKVIKYRILRDIRNLLSMKIIRVNKFLE